MPKADRWVVDSNIVLKWFVPNEENAEKAGQLLEMAVVGEIELHAPSVLYYEIGVVLARWGSTRRKARGEQYMSLKESTQILEFLADIDIRITNFSVRAAQEAVEMCVRYSKGFKDMMFLQLAKELDCRLLTDDRKMVQGITDSFPRDHVVLLSEWD